MRKNFVCRAQYLRNHSSYDHHLFFVAQVQNDDIFRCFFHFFKFWFSVLGCYGVEGKRAKNGPKWQKNSNSVSQEPHNCGFWCTCVTFFFFFFFFQNFDFSGFSKLIKKCQKELLRCAPPSSHVCDFLNKTEAIFRKVFCEKHVLIIWQISRENTCAGVTFPKK